MPWVLIPGLAEANACCAVLCWPAAGGLLLHALAPLPLGTMVILPGLVLTPLLAPLTPHQSAGVMPYSFGGNCNLLGKPVNRILGNTPTDILGLIPPGTCLPPGWLYNIGNLTASGFPKTTAGLPDGTVVLSDKNVFVPPGVPDKDAAEALEQLPGRLGCGAPSVLLW